MNELKILDVPIQILHQRDDLLIAQTHAGVFNKFNKDDIYGQFNLALHVHDDAESVLHKRAILLKKLSEITKKPVHAIHWVNQVHSDRIVIATTDDLQMSAQSADALITRCPNHALAIMTADCVPVVIYDQNHSVIACIHAGWQGLTQGIIAKTVEQLRKESRSDLFAHMGACITWQSYQIDLELAQRIIKACVQSNFVHMKYDELFHQIVHASYDEKNEKNQNKAYIDLQKLTSLQLKTLGVKLQNQTAPCSYKVSNLYSYRVQTHTKKPATGRMATLVIRF